MSPPVMKKKTIRCAKPKKLGHGKCVKPKRSKKGRNRSKPAKGRKRSWISDQWRESYFPVAVVLTRR